MFYCFYLCGTACCKKLIRFTNVCKECDINQPEVDLMEKASVYLTSGFRWNSGHHKSLWALDLLSHKKKKIILSTSVSPIAH